MTDDVLRKPAYRNPDKGQAMTMIADAARSRVEKSARLKAQRLERESAEPAAPPAAPPARKRKPKS